MKSIIVSLILLSGFAVIADEIVYSNVPRVETIYGMSYSNNGLRIQVESNGCTSKDSFMVLKEMSADGLAHVVFVRTRPDWCRGFVAEGAFIEFSNSDLGLSDREGVRVDNPFGPNNRSSE